MEEQVLSLPLIGPIWQVIDEAYYGRANFLLAGLEITLLVGLSALPLSIVCGLLGSWAKLSHSLPARVIGGTYTTIVRGVPELILILLVYYGITQGLQDGLLAITGEDIRINLNPFITGTLTLGLIYGAFMTETLRGAFQSLDKGQVEAARAIGMSRKKAFFRVVLPQVWRYALPGIGNNWMVLIKATALMSVVQLDELMRQSDVAARAVRKPFLFYMTAALIFLLITVISLRAQRRAEAWANRGVRSA
ncbi:ABC transporter permease [Limibacillus halophilus]|jgi:His/Glu/Gln/Arg/opine family amino acid ABC transporter permease subunit